MFQRPTNDTIGPMSGPPVPREPANWTLVPPPPPPPHSPPAAHFGTLPFVAVFAVLTAFVFGLGLLFWRSGRTHGPMKNLADTRRSAPQVAATPLTARGLGPQCEFWVGGRSSR